MRVSASGTERQAESVERELTRQSIQEEKIVEVWGWGGQGEGEVISSQE